MVAACCTLAADGNREQYRISGVHFAALICATIWLYVVVGERVAFLVQIDFMHKPSVVVCWILRIERSGV